MNRSVQTQNSGGCVVDGIEQDCSMASNETAVQCPDNDCGPRLAVWKSGKITVTFGFGRDPKTGKYGFSAPRWANGSFTIDGQTTNQGDYIAGYDFVGAGGQQDESLPSCVYNLLLPYFADVNVHGENYNAVKNVWFHAGLGDLIDSWNGIAKRVKDATGVQLPDSGAMTVGVKVNYDKGTIPSFVLVQCQTESS